MARMLVTYYTRSGNTEQMAKEVEEGARQVSGIDVHRIAIGEVTPDDLLSYDAIVVGSPVYYGTMAAEVKKLIDDSVMHHGRLSGKVGAAFATSGVAGGGCETTILDIIHSLLVHGMVVQGDSGGPHYGPIAIGAPDAAAQDQCRKLGARTAELTVRLHG
jgi:NAD(P)H dehydrogenase (quinone)